MESELIDEEGYLIDPNKWYASAAEEFARQEDIQLTKDHCGHESRNKIFELFQYGYVKQACKIAGMKRL